MTGSPTSSVPWGEGGNRRGLGEDRFGQAALWSTSQRPPPDKSENTLQTGEQCAREDQLENLAGSGRRIRRQLADVDQHDGDAGMSPHAHERAK